ncbi:MAG: DUF853 domain-containing protein, partial [Cellvibrionaceae bacterium]|nr:DUF853 domain-containing protein [Cellvibrionaceae bacterium]
MKTLLLGGNGSEQVLADAAQLNRHGLIAGATGTGKTVSLQVIIEQLSAAGVPSFVPDIKGDLSGLGAAGKAHRKVSQRLDFIGIANHAFTAVPAVFWDIKGKKGHPIRTTVSEMGPLLLSNLLELNDTQSGILYACFREADAQGWLMLDLEDLNAMLQCLGENAKTLKQAYGNISAASIGAIRRRLLVLEEQGLADFLGEPAVQVQDLIHIDDSGKGLVNILEAATLIQQSPRLYSTLLLWLLSELYEDLPEVGDLEKPKLVIFIDEAHLMFKLAGKALLEKVEQVVRLIRSKGVGVVFITQNPLDIPDAVAGQLGLKVQHALRAFTAKDKKSIRAVAANFRANPHFDTETVLPELAVGEALVSSLDNQGKPTVVEKTLMSPPVSKIGPIALKDIKTIMANSPHGEKFNQRINRESAHELLKKRAQQSA